jgi:hypothetical protein
MVRNMAVRREGEKELVKNLMGNLLEESDLKIEEGVTQ